MYFITRAVAYLKKQKSKTILLSVLFFLIANIVLAGLSIQKATETATVLTRQEIGADIVYTVNASQLNADYRNGLIDANVDKSSLAGIPLVSNADQLLNSDYIVAVDYVASYEATSEALIPYTVTVSETTTSTGNGGSKIILGTYEDNGDVSFRTFSRPQPSDFTDKLAVLAEGRFATQAEIDAGTPVVLIEQTLADLNGWILGDRFTVYPTSDGYEAVPMTYEIIGIYTSQEVVDDRTLSTTPSSLLAQNRMYTPFNTLLTMGQSASEIDAILLSKAVITLDDPIHITDYMTSIDGLFPLTYGIIDANDDIYESLAGPIETLGDLSSVMVWIVVIAGALILSLITALTINQRKNEIGILLAIGESKTKIVAQFIVETVLIAIMAFTLSVFSGIQIGQTISTKTLDVFLTTEPTVTTVVPQGKGSKTTVPTKTMEAPEVDVKLDPLVLIQFFGAGLLIAMVSVAIPALYVTRFNPKQILTNNG